ncbi:MAG: SRPBCC domain-containing protein [Pseudomonadales bacterium]|nr:SRPBCC domain-containing protein [Pseudomonadales bacterium]
MSSDWAIAVDKSVALSVEEVYRAWLEPALVKRWMAPGTMRVSEPTIDARPDGEWQLVMIDVDGGPHKASGKYTSLTEPSALALTWAWDGGHYTTQITVTIDAGANGKTDVCLEQRGFPSMDVAQSHEAGWAGCLEKLGKLQLDS